MKTRDIITANKFRIVTLIPQMLTTEYITCLNDYDIKRYLGDMKYSRYTLKDEVEYIDNILKSDVEYLFAIMDISEKPIGNIHLTIDKRNKRCQIAYVIVDKQAWGSGIATEAVGLITSWTFENLDIYRMDAGYIEENQASAKVLERNGYVIEGRRRGAALLLDGRRCDEIETGLTREDYYRRKTENNE